MKRPSPLYWVISPLLKGFSFLNYFLADKSGHSTNTFGEIMGTPINHDLFIYKKLNLKATQLTIPVKQIVFQVYHQNSFANIIINFYGFFICTGYFHFLLCGFVFFNQVYFILPNDLSNMKLECAFMRKFNSVTNSLTWFISPNLNCSSKTWEMVIYDLEPFVKILLLLVQIQQLSTGPCIFVWMTVSYKYFLPINLKQNLKYLQLVQSFSLDASMMTCHVLEYIYIYIYIYIYR